jgi:MSHA pilin protein MshC
MRFSARGFTLIELITVIILTGILSVVLVSRLGPTKTAAIQASRDDLIAALFFAQQTAMMRSTGTNIKTVVTSNSVSVTENDIPIKLSTDHYPLSMPQGVNLSPVTLVYDKLGRTTANTITLTGSGNSAGVSASVTVEASGYAYAN